MQNPALATTEHPPSQRPRRRADGRGARRTSRSRSPGSAAATTMTVPVPGDAAAVRVVPDRRVGTGAGRRRPQDPQGRDDRAPSTSSSLESRAAESTPAGPEIPYHQVEIGPRKPLPFTRRTIEVDAAQAGRRRRGRTGRAGGHRRRRLLGGLPVPRSHGHAHGAGRAARRAPVAAVARHARRGPRRRRHHRRAVRQGAPGARPRTTRSSTHPGPSASSAGRPPRPCASTTDARTTVKDAARPGRCPCRRWPTSSSSAAARSRRGSCRRTPWPPRPGRRGPRRARSSAPAPCRRRRRPTPPRRSSPRRAGVAPISLAGFASALSAGRRTARGNPGAVAHAR